MGPSLNADLWTVKVVSRGCLLLLLYSIFSVFFFVTCVRLRFFTFINETKLFVCFVFLLDDFLFLTMCLCDSDEKTNSNCVCVFVLRLWYYVL